jgi:hypothetical protein
VQRTAGLCLAFIQRVGLVVTFIPVRYLALH